MRSVARRLFLALALASPFFVFSTNASAQVGASTATPKEDPDALFDEGNKLMDAGRNAEACPLFERSLALDPSLGTRLNLAICWEKVGRLGSAYRMLRDVATVAHDTGKTKREETAVEHLTAIRKRASFATITLADEPSAGVVVRIDGRDVTSTDYAFVPLDPGEHQVEAIAARKKPFQSVVVVTASEGERHEVDVPKLEAEVVVERKVETVVNTKRTISYIAGGLGLAGLVTAVVTGVMVGQAESTADEHCTRAVPGSDKLGCDAEGSSAVKRGETLLPINAVAIGVAVVGVGVGSYLFFTSTPRTTPAVSASVGPSGVSLVGRF